jgi:hypothetical protein
VWFLFDVVRNNKLYIFTFVVDRITITANKKLSYWNVKHWVRWLLAVGDCRPPTATKAAERPWTLQGGMALSMEANLSASTDRLMPSRSSNAGTY